MLGAHALHKIDYLEVSLLHLFRKVWANGPLEQHDDLCWGSMRSIKLIISSRAQMLFQLFFELALALFVSLDMD